MQAAMQQACSWVEARLSNDACLSASVRETSGTYDSSSRVSPRRLETHVWHAKRLAMIERWAAGFKVVFTVAVVVCCPPRTSLDGPAANLYLRNVQR